MDIQPTMWSFNYNDYNEVSGIRIDATQRRWRHKPDAFQSASTYVALMRLCILKESTVHSIPLIWISLLLSLTSANLWLNFMWITYYTVRLSISEILDVRWSRNTSRNGICCTRLDCKAHATRMLVLKKFCCSMEWEIMISSIAKPSAPR